MPINGNITDKCRRCLENLAVSGPSTAAELDALDPLAPPHKQTLKSAQQIGYVVLETHLNHKEPARFTLTAKAKTLLYGTATEPGHKSATPAPVTARAKRYANNQAGLRNITPPITHGSMATGRMFNACSDMLAPAVREGAEQALQIPTRVNDVLHYRDGRRVDVKSMR